MSKYNIGDKFKHSRGSDTVRMKIIFVPPLDGDDNQYYLIEIFSLYNNGGDKHFYQLDKEEAIDTFFIKRK